MLVLVLVFGSCLEVASGSVAGADCAAADSAGAVLRGAAGRGAARFLGADFFFGADFFAAGPAARLAVFFAFLGAARRAVFLAVFFEDFLAPIFLCGAAFLAFFFDLEPFDFFAFDLRAAMMNLHSGLRATILRPSRAIEKSLNATAPLIVRERRDSSRIIHITGEAAPAALARHTPSL